MSQTERSQIFKKWKPQSETECISSFASTSKRKGLSLSKTLQQNTEQRTHSFIKLSARQKNATSTERRSIRLIVKQRPEPQQVQVADKENQMRNANHQIIFGKDCGFEHLLGNGRKDQWPEVKTTHNNPRTRQQLPNRQSHTVMPTARMLHLRL
jgi:hypothetical protein